MGLRGCGREPRSPARELARRLYINTIISDEFAYPSTVPSKTVINKEATRSIISTGVSHTKHIPSAAFFTFCAIPGPFHVRFFSFRLSVIAAPLSVPRAPPSHGSLTILILVPHSLWHAVFRPKNQSPSNVLQLCKI